MLFTLDVSPGTQGRLCAGAPLDFSTTFGPEVGFEHADMALKMAFARQPVSIDTDDNSQQSDLADPRGIYSIFQTNTYVQASSSDSERRHPVPVP